VAEHARWVRQLRRSRLLGTRSPMTRSIFSLAMVLAVVSPALMLTATPASAQDTVAETDAEIERLFADLEPVIEDYNAARIELKEKEKAADELAETLEPLQDEVEAAQAEVTDIAVYTYKGGNLSAVNALLSTGSPLTIADQLAVLDQFAKSQQETIDAAAAAAEEYKAEQEELNTAIDELTELEDELAAQADEIENKIDDLKDLRVRLLGDQAAPVSTGNAGACPPYDPGGAAGIAIRFACAQMGKAYSYGASGPNSYDCSGLTSAAWAEAGVSLPHNAAAQRDAVGYVERSDLQPGDLVFYYSGLSHVALYAGDGYVMEASNPTRPLGMSPIDQKPIHSYGRP
jgi:peptidoglycan DL-endopeptidase CwlO